MRKNSIDYQELHNTLTNKTYKFADVKHKMQRVGFDIYRIAGENLDELWQIQNADDGDYIVARYETDPEEVVEKTASKWDVLITTGSENINIFYNGHPITKMASSKLGIKEDEVNLIKNFLPKKLASDKVFVRTLLALLDNSSRTAIYNLYPELK